MTISSLSALRRSLLSFVMAGAVTSVSAACAQSATTLGGVNTSFHLFGSHDVQVSSFTDPDLPVTCYLSRAQTGGIKGAVGIAKNPTRFSLSCVKSGGVPTDITKLPKQQNITKLRNSFLFTNLVITRMIDQEHSAVVYLVTSQGLIDGSPANAISAVSW